MIDAKALDEILKEVISKIEESKNEMYDIAETARQECYRVEQAMKNIKKETLKVVEQVDLWEKKEIHARLRLAEVSSKFDEFGEEEMRDAYEKARDVQVKLASLREKEEHYKQRRLELEVQYKTMKQTAEKAEALVSKVGIAMNFLSSNLQDIQNEVGKINNWQEQGLAIIKAQELERRRVARGIHDGPAQSLANIVLRLEFCEKIIGKKPEVLPEELSQLKVFARKTLGEIRKILFDLRPADLDDLGLVAALRRFLSDFQEKSGIIVDFICACDEQTYPPELEVAAFRIVQECINNIKKHSEASHVRVNLELTPLKIRIIINDDGIGFNVGESLKANQFGLRGMQEWARMLGGEVNIESAPNRGTRVSAVIPLRRSDV